VIDFADPQEIQFLRTALYYILNMGNIVDVEQFIKEAQQLPESVRGEVMTAAEQLKAIGAKEGKKEGIEKEWLRNNYAIKIKSILLKKC
jgi:hypothetical protein